MKVTAIGKLYADKCENRGLNFYSVPKSKQDEVRYIIENDGYEILDDGTVVEVVDAAEIE